MNRYRYAARGVALVITRVRNRTNMITNCQTKSRDINIDIGCLVVTFAYVKSFFYPSGTGSLTFQALLYPNGKVSLQYFGMNPGMSTLTNATVGIQNTAGDDGLEIVYNSAYMHDYLTIEIAAAHWLSIDPAGGSIDPMSTLPANVTTRQPLETSYS